MRREPRAARPDDSPPAVALGILKRLSDEEPDSFAGTVMRPDGSIELRVTKVTPVVTRAADHARSASGGAIAVTVVDGFRFGLAELESVRDKILARIEELASRGVRITEFSADIRANKVRIGVKDLTPEKAALLADEFGADRVDIVQGGEWVG